VRGRGPRAIARRRSGLHVWEMRPSATSVYDPQIIGARSENPNAVVAARRIFPVSCIILEISGG